MIRTEQKIYRGAVIGCGRMGSRIDDENKFYHFPYPWSHAGAMVESKRVELVAGADLLPSQREDFKQRWGVEAVYAEVNEMLAKEKPDFVSITTQHHERAEVILACAEAGVKIIYPTKPVCLTLAEGDQVIKKCQDLGALLAVSCHQNWNPWFHACLEAIGRGEIGQLTTLISQQIPGDHNAGLFRLFAKSSPVWVMASRTDRGRAGIIGFENGIHGIDTLVENHEQGTPCNCRASGLWNAWRWKSAYANPLPKTALNCASLAGSEPRSAEPRPTGLYQGNG